METMRKFLVTVFLATLPALAADSTKLEIRVSNEAGRPIENASVVIKFRGGAKVKPNPKFRTEWDVKTSQDGLVKLPSIQKGPILIQIRADNFQTFGQVFDVQEDERLLEIKLKPPQPQYSAHDKDKDK
jgi:Carboxypeptidase regulatory-like domain